MIISLRMLQVMNFRVTATTRLIRCSQAAASPFGTRRPLCKLWLLTESPARVPCDNCAPS